MASASLSTGGEGASGEASFGLAAAWSVSLACLFFRNKAIANIFTSNAPPNTTLSRKPRAWATNRAGSRAGSEWRQLGAHRKSARAGVLKRRLEPRVGLDRADKVMKLLSQVRNVVRDNHSARRHQGDDQFEIANVVLLPGVNENEFKRPLELGEFFERVAALQGDQGVHARPPEIFLREARPAFVNFQRQQVAAAPAQAQGSPDP